MKQISFLSYIFLIVLSSCSKEDDQVAPIPDKLDIKNISLILGSSIPDCKKLLPDYLLLSEQVTLGNTSLNYLANTKEGTYDLQIDFDSKNIAKQVKGFTLMDTTSSTMINLTNSLSDRFFEAMYNKEYVYYALWYYDYGMSKKTYYLKADYWNYIRDNGVSNKVVEYWLLSSIHGSFLAYDKSLDQILFSFY